MDRTEKISIILIDDEQDVRSLLKAYLKKHDVQVYEAYSAEEALPLINQHKISIAVIDIGLPGKSGLDFLKQVKQEIPFEVISIMLTGQVEREHIKQALTEGAYSFLDKPCDPVIFSNIINRARELAIYKRELNDILEFLICEYGKFSWEEYKELSIEQKANLLTMIKGILALKVTRRKSKQKD